MAVILVNGMYGFDNDASRTISLGSCAGQGVYGFMGVMPARGIWFHG